MTMTFSVDSLERENRQFENTGGVSAANQSLQFVPAFCDIATGQAYQSCFSNGEPAPMHVLDGLPETLIVERNPSGAVVAVKHSVISGFLRLGRFYTRDEAAALV